jgi:hypothetical protein
MASCSKCGDEKDARGLAAHERSCGGGVAVAEKPQPFVPRSNRGRRELQGEALTPLQQVRIIPSSRDKNFSEVTNAWAYYIRPDGATIRDALILSPNGGVPELDDQKKRAIFGRNAELYRAQMRAKGYEYVGPRLTVPGVKRLVEVIMGNRQDEILYCEDSVVNCQSTIDNSDRPEVRDQARKRKAQFERRLEYLRQDIDADAMVAELDDIAKAQELASLDPKLARILRSMIGEKVSVLEDLVSRMTRTSGEGAPRVRKDVSEGAVFDD